MNCSKRMKRNIKKMAWLVFCGFCFGITPYVFYMADLERGYNATGSELIVPFIPILLYVFGKGVKEIKFEMKGMNIND